MIYLYKCEKCKTVQEHKQSIHDEPLTECKCTGVLNRIMPKNVAISFKGAGFYVNDKK